MSLRLSQLEYGALLAYSPHGYSPEIQHSKGVMNVLKNDSFLQKPPMLMSQWVASTIRQNMSTLPFASFFQPNTILIPTPKSSLMREGSLWVPDRLATTLVERGLGKEVARCLIRVEPVPKAAFSAAFDRPTAARHYETMQVQGRISEPDEIVLVDDVITRGATLLGAANRLADAFPQARIRAFAAMRTISNPDEFAKEYDPVVGDIRLRPSGDTLRRP